MPELSKEKTIKETLDVIRKAINEDYKILEDEKLDVLLSNQLVKDDGTIENINTNIDKKEIIEILEKKLSEEFELHLEKWFDKNIPNYLEKYLSKKNWK